MLRKGSDEPVEAVLAWPTAGRRACLADSIEGFARNLAEHGRKAPILLAADFPFGTFEPALAESAARSARSYGFSLLVSDGNSRERFLKRVGHDFDPDVAGYAFLSHPDGRGSGRNYNAVMLAAAGGLAVSTDDDILCVPAVRRGTLGPSAVEFTSEAFPLEYLYRKDREEVLAGVERIDVDVLAEHRKFLGARAAGGDGGKKELSFPGRVLLTSPGTYGDSGFGRARTVLALKGGARREVIAGGYAGLKFSREVTRIAERNLVGPSMNFMAMQSGWDCRELLPPFLPVGRNPDGFFAFLLRLLDPGSLTAFLGYGYLHDAGERRGFDPESLTAFKPYLSELLMALALGLRPSRGAADAGDRFRELGDKLEEAASLATEDFAHFLHEAWSKGAEAYAGLLEKLLEDNDRVPADWAEDTESHLASVYEMLREPSYLFGKRGCGLSVEQVREHAASYGRLLGIWPDLLERAAGLNREGMGISEKLPTDA